MKAGLLKNEPPRAPAAGERRETLRDFFEDLYASPADFLVFDDGYRAWTYKYEHVRGAAYTFAAHLRRERIGKGDKIILWGENRPEWIVALCGAVSEGVIVVPIDYRSSAELVQRIQGVVQSRALLVGDDVRVESIRDVPVWRMAEIDWSPSDAPSDRVPIEAGDTAEIIFTSGATAEPKGVVLTHRNVLTNIVPIERAVAKYRPLAWPVSPVRFLDVLPLSHMFGQAMAAFIPPMLTGAVVLIRGYNPREIVRQLKTRRISVLVCVPKMLDLLREYAIQQIPDARAALDAKTARRSIPMRLWQYRAVHRLLGWKFWSFVVGAAPLDRELEEFWSRLGFVVVQGYGLTETAPVVSVNHPFKPGRGTVGAPIPGVDVKIAPDGEILVRGENVTPGYFQADKETAAAFEGGWFHTGDIGEMDESGRLIIRGRKKEMIVTPEGLNIFPEDVERVLDEIGGVRESAVVGVTRDGEERVHAVLALESGAKQDDVVRQANAKLEDHQKIRSASVWTADGLPRTEGTRKLKRRELKRWAETGGAPAERARPAGARTVAAIVAELAHRGSVNADTTLDELGLSSLERIELMTALEEQFDTTIDEPEFSNSRTVGDLEKLRQHGTRVTTEPVPRGAQVPEQPAGRPEARRPPGSDAMTFPAWNRGLWARAARRASLPVWILPLARAFAWVQVRGLERLEQLDGPAIFASNHLSHLDTPAILMALPPRWRYRVAPAMAKDFFDAHFHPERHPWSKVLTLRSAYYLAALFFNAFPIPRREAGTRETLRYIGDLVSNGFSILIFPEGHISHQGDVLPFQPGVGMLASRLNVPVVPVRLQGLDRVLHPTWRMARPGRATVTFGAPVTLRGQDYRALTKQVEEAVKAL
ncbi:MAG TPA: AMP-binding protein [Vicinamibacterales bacterium]|nr:AMP-binding protein [Vicinamibacterales bacterium]